MATDDFDTDLGFFTRALFMPKVDFLARELYWAMDGLGTDENTLTDVNPPTVILKRSRIVEKAVLPLHS